MISVDALVITFPDLKDIINCKCRCIDLGFRLKLSHRTRKSEFDIAGEISYDPCM